MVRRRLDYYKKRKVIHCEKTGESSEYSYGYGRIDCVTYTGLVRGKSPSSRKSRSSFSACSACSAHSAEEYDYGDDRDDDDRYYIHESQPVLSPEEAKAYNKPDAPVYHVTINTGKVKKSTCDCAFAKGRYVICKHMVALFLEAQPEQLNLLYKEIEDNKRAEEERQQEKKDSRRRELERRARGMSHAELEEEYVKISIRLNESWEELQEAYRARWRH